MTWVMTAVYAVTAVSGAVSARGQYLAGKNQQMELERQAEEERISAQSRELQRIEQLNEALAANVVGQAMSGISGEGTPASLALASAKKVGLSELTIDLSEKLKQAQLRRQGKAARQTGKLQAASTLLKTGAQMASLVPTKAPTKAPGNATGSSYSGGYYKGIK